MKKLEELASAKVLGKKKFLVTGGSGFIGCHTVIKILELGHEVINFDLLPPASWAIEDNIKKNPSYTFKSGDTKNKREVFDCVERVDYVIHLAGILGTHETMFAIEETTKNNVLGTINVFEALKYSQKIGAYITLGNDWENPYTISKTCSARFAFMFNREFQTRISVIRGLNVYGTKQKLFPVIKAIPTFIYKAILGEDIPVYGDGEQIIDLVSASDTVETLIRSVIYNKEEQYSSIIDAGTGVETSVIESVKLILELVGETQENNGKISNIRNLPMRRGEPIKSKTLGDVANVENYLDFSPSTNIRDGMIETVNWYKENYKILEKDKIN